MALNWICRRSWATQSKLMRCSGRQRVQGHGKDSAWGSKFDHPSRFLHMPMKINYLSGFILMFIICMCINIIYLYLSLSLSLYINAYIDMHTCTCVYIYTHAHTYTHKQAYMYMYMYMYRYRYMYMYMYMCMYIHACVYVSVYIYVHTLKSTCNDSSRTSWPLRKAANPREAE